MRAALRLLGSACALAAFTSATAAEFMPLETDTATDGLYTFGVSPNGGTVVLDGNPDGYRWTLGEPAPQPLGMLASNSYSMPWDVNDAGMAVGRGDLEGNAYAVRWFADGSLEELPLPAPFNGGEAFKLSADGAVIAGVAGDGYTHEAVRWVNGSPEVLDVGMGSSIARSVSADGSVVVGEADFAGNGTFSAFLWTPANGGSELIPGPSVATDISGDGSTVVGEHFNGSYQEAFRWAQSLGAENLGELPGGYELSHANAVSDDGAIVVGYSEDSDGMKAFIWRQDFGMRDLNEWLMLDQGLDLLGWVLVEATDISGDGNVIVGIGRKPDGNYASWAVRLDGSSTSFTDGDGDGMSDEWEMQYGLDPYYADDAEWDMDGDGLTNLQEFESGNDPHNWDTNGNGISDGDEAPADPDADSDADGIPDEWEMQYGMDPYFADDAYWDFDGDGLTNLREYETGNDPHNWDTNGNGISDGDEAPADPDADSDGDTMPDGWEVEHGLDPYYAGDAEWDMDNDWLLNFEEYQAGTDPNNADTDGDGLLDGDEFRQGLDPANPDTDGDTMPDGWELQNGFNPADATDGSMDADGDWLTNADEYAHGTNPHHPDTDDDMFGDGDELQAGTDPLNPDSDADGMPDGWEVMYALDPLNPADAGTDVDYDGLANVDEYAAGTDPRSYDTDGDGISDGEEVAFGTSPTRADTDQDGIADGEEPALGLDATAFDSNGNGVMDGLEHGNIVRVNVSANGNESAKDMQAHVSVSADGRFVVFSSADDNLVPGDTNEVADVFVRDVHAGTIERVSVGTGDVQANNRSWIARHNVISADGRFIVFRSSATDLVNGYSHQIYLHDRATGETTVLAPETESGSNSNPVISADGRYVAFESNVASLTGRTDGTWKYDVVWLDRDTGETRLVTETIDGASPTDYSRYVSISGDGRTVAYSSDASNLVAGDTNGVADVFVRDIDAGTTTRISVAADGTQADRSSYYGASLTHDGGKAVFESNASNLIANDTNGTIDVFLYDFANGSLERISTAPDGTEGTGYSSEPTISTDGSRVAFRSAARNFSSQNCYYSQVYVRDLMNGAMFLASTPNSGECGNSASGRQGVALSADSSHVAFKSEATNLVPGDSNYADDVFIRRIDW